MWNCFITSCGIYYVINCGIMCIDLCCENFYYSNEPPTQEYVYIETEEN